MCPYVGVVGDPEMFDAQINMQWEVFSHCVPEIELSYIQPINANELQNMR